MKKTLLILGILFLFSAATAQAGFNFGIKTLSLTEMTGSYSYVRTNQMFGCYFGFDVGSQVVILGGLDFYHMRMKENWTAYPWIVPADPTYWEDSYTSFTPNIGVKFYLMPRTSGDIAAYLQANLFKTFTSYNDDDNYIWTDIAQRDLWEEVDKEVLSPFGFYTAFGVEYFVSDNFSVGGEMGIRFSFGKGEASGVINGVNTTLTLNDDYISHYVGFTLNYFFGER